jgi:catechol 2,3-dioxygenase-like lactoylglutathione lyase family enzyme
MDRIKTAAAGNTMTTPSTQSNLEGATPFASWKVDHAAIRVPDFDRALAWYSGKLGFRLKNQVSFAGLIFAFLSPAGNDEFTFEMLAGPGASNRLSYADLHDSYKAAGWHHLCFRVENVDLAVGQLKQRGVTIVSEPHDVVPMGLRVAFFADPWANLFELTQLIAGPPLP